MNTIIIDQNQDDEAVAALLFLHNNNINNILNTIMKHVNKGDNNSKLDCQIAIKQWILNFVDKNAA